MGKKIAIIDIAADPPSSAVEITGLPNPPVVVVDVILVTPVIP